MKKYIPQTLKNIYHLAWAVLANIWFDFPSQKIKVIGITGTNGKTTTTQMVTRILEHAGFKVAMASTINFQIKEKKWINITKYTTLSAWEVQQFIFKAVKADCQYVVLETSSHALDQYRVWGVDYEIAVITNVTREHLDYHQTIKQYRLAKLKLFKKSKIGIVNMEMENPEEFFQFNNQNQFGYTTNDNHKVKNQDEILIIKAENVQLSLAGAIFIVNNQHFDLKLIGKFNVENALAAIAVALSQKIDLSIASQALQQINHIPGRMDFVANNRGLQIIIDYALTPDSMEKLGQIVNQMTINIQPKPNLIWVFGSCGQRDRGKRPIMGKIVSKYANYLIVTNEDPYDEDPWQIINDIFIGVTKNEETEAWKILDRRQAIKKALELAKTNDIILVTGKGAEETMAIKDQRIPWNDRHVIEEELSRIF